MNLISKLFEKRGITDERELSNEERLTIKRWRSVFEDSEVTVEKIKEFCDAQLSIIEGQFANLDNTFEKNDRLILAHTIYKKISRLISAPQAEREQLEKYLQQLIDSSDTDRL